MGVGIGPGEGLGQPPQWMTVRHGFDPHGHIACGHHVGWKFLFIYVLGKNPRTRGFKQE